MLYWNSYIIVKNCVLLKSYARGFKRIMSKIFFKVNDKKPPRESSPQPAETEKKELRETENEDANSASEGVQIALFHGDEQVPAQTENTVENAQETFDKEKIFKYFQRHPKKTVNTKVDRFSPKLNKGLTS